MKQERTIILVGRFDCNPRAIIEVKKLCWRLRDDFRAILLRKYHILEIIKTVNGRTIFQNNVIKILFSEIP